MVEHAVVSFAECEGSLRGSMDAHTTVVTYLHVASSTLITVLPESCNIDRTSLTL